MENEGTVLEGHLGNEGALSFPYDIFIFLFSSCSFFPPVSWSLRLQACREVDQGFQKRLGRGIAKSPSCTNPWLTQPGTGHGCGLSVTENQGPFSSDEINLRSFRKGSGGGRLAL